MHVAEIWRYPVKSLGGERLEHVVVRPDGLHFDRNVLVVNQENEVLTSRDRKSVV